MGFGFDFRSVKIKATSIDHVELFSPGAFTASGWSKSGPIGLRIMARLAEIIFVRKDKLLVSQLDSFITHFRDIYQFPRYHEQVSILKPRALINYLGPKLQELESFLQDEVLVKKFGLRNIGTLRSLISFPDGLGKNRYIAISD